MTKKKKAVPAVPTEDDVVEADTPEQAAAVAEAVAGGRLKDRIREKAEAADDGEVEEDADPNLPPAWAIIPADLKLPTKGRKVWFVRFLGRWTDAPHKGDRQCILWGLTEEDEKIAVARAQNNMGTLHIEMAKMMIRAVDGQKVNWGHGTAPSGPGAKGTTPSNQGNVRVFWREIGAACRQMIVSIYTTTATLPLEERKLFFTECVAVRTSTV